MLSQGEKSLTQKRNLKKAKRQKKPNGKRKVAKKKREGNSLVYDIAMHS